MDDWFPVRGELEASCRTWADLKPLEWVEIPENCNWKVSVENYSECYHCSLNHPTFATGVIKPETYDIQPQGYCLRHTTECQNLDQMSYPSTADSPTCRRYSSGSCGRCSRFRSIRATC
jgi:phenylpropionate dioxygenase-like ring-hydroxylating dioxygenase large terminal subunit